MAQGVYKPDQFVLTRRPNLGRGETFQLKTAVVIKGGYAGLGEPDRNTRDIELYETVLSGDRNGDDGLLPHGDKNDNCFHVVTVPDTCKAAVLDGFTVTGGYATSSSTLYECGGGIYCLGEATVVNCRVSGNEAVCGGGVYCYLNTVIANCVIAENNAVGCGGGIWARGSNEAGNLKIVNCTFYGNLAAEEGGGVLCSELSGVWMENCILWGDDAADGAEIAIVPFDWGATLSIVYSDVWGGEAGVYVGPLSWPDLDWGPGNIDVDPCFADLCNGDYHLKSQAGRWEPTTQTWVKDDVTSPCIDGGDPNADYSNEPTPNGGRINMGAYGGTAYASKKTMRWSSNDLNRDGWTDIMDLAILGENWLKHGPARSNEPPTVKIETPQSGAELQVEGLVRIRISADALDADGYVKKVEFYANGEKIGEDVDGTDGWSTNWGGYPYAVNVYNITARASDDDGATSNSLAVVVKVAPEKGQPKVPPWACFPADTPVWADGVLVRISEVTPGQRVGKMNSGLGVGYEQQIESVDEHEGIFECYDIVLENGNSISVVSLHYFLADSNTWVPLQELRRDLKLQSLEGPLRITDIVQRETLFAGKVCNLKMKNSDQYFIGKDGIVVRDW